MKNRELRIGQEITIMKNDMKRKGRVVFIHREHRWFGVEFRGNYWNPFKGKYDTYRECFRLNTNNVQL